MSDGCLGTRAWPPSTVTMCLACNQPCSTHLISDGIGAYEFWGYPGYDSKPYFATTCCDATPAEQPTPQETP